MGSEMCIRDRFTTPMHDVVTYDLNMPKTGTQTAADVIEAIKTYLRRSRNISVDKVNFHGRVQQEGESFVVFASDLRRLHSIADLCQVCKDDAISHRILVGMRDAEARRSILKKQTTPPLTDMIREIQAELRSHTDNVKLFPTPGQMVAAAGLDDGASIAGESIYGAQQPQAILPGQLVPVQQFAAQAGTAFAGQPPVVNYAVPAQVAAVAQQGGRPTGQKCGNCGRNHKPGREACPAQGKTCNTCGKANHFANVCRAKKKKDGAAAAVTVGTVSANAYTPTDAASVSYTHLTLPTIYSV